MKSIKILNGLLIIWVVGAIITFLITFTLIFSFAKTISTKHENADTRWGEYQCGDNWHGHIEQCSFDDSFKENIPDAILAGILILLPIIAFSTILWEIAIKHKKITSINRL